MKLKHTRCGESIINPEFATLDLVWTCSECGDTFAWPGRRPPSNLSASFFRGSGWELAEDSPPEVEYVIVRKVAPGRDGKSYLCTIPKAQAEAEGLQKVKLCNF